METTKLSSKGQIIIPKAVRDARGWGPGTTFEIEETKDGIMLRPAKPFPSTHIDSVIGCLKWNGPPKTIEEMDAAVLAAAKRRWKRNNDRT